MSTISVPLPADLDKFVRDEAKRRGSNKAAVVRYALKMLAEEEAVQAVLRAEKELAEGKGMKGDLRELLKKFS